MKNETVLITGSSKRVGRSIAIKLAEEGFNIAIHYNNSSKESHSLQKELKKYNVKVKTFKLDLQKTDRIKFFFRNVLNYFGEISILINNASTFEFDSIKNATIKSYDKHLDVNLKAPFFLSKYFVEARGKKKGNIINILDQRVMNTTPYFTSYTISKSALLTLTRSLALSLAPKIRVNAIAPSLVNTPLASKFLNNDTKLEKANERHPLGRIGSAKEIAQATAFLLGEESSWMTGRVLQLDGGIGNLKT